MWIPAGWAGAWAVGLSHHEKASGPALGLGHTQPFAPRPFNSLPLRGSQIESRMGSQVLPV